MNSARGQLQMTGESSMNVRRIALTTAILAAAGMFTWCSEATRAAEPDQQSSKPPAFQTAKVARGDLAVLVRATGTIEPEEVVDVGAQVEGRIVAFGADPGGKGKAIDYGSQVEKDQVLAVIDDAMYKARVDEEQAALQGAKAQLDLAKAKLQAVVTAIQRTEGLAAGNGVTCADVAVAKADELPAKAAVDVAAAGVAKQQATLRAAQLNFEATKIKSPIVGTIIDRRVNVGQTVTPSLNAPSLFLIAKDLKKLEIWASVNEGDIGRIHVGQNAAFTVEAFPGRSFQGKVSQVRLNAQMTQNVVTYTVVVAIDNADGTLLPYLTAGVEFEVARHVGVLMVPNAALRMRPETAWIAPDARDKVDPTQSEKAAALHLGSRRQIHPSRPRSPRPKRRHDDRDSRRRFEGRAGSPSSERRRR